MGLRGVPTEYNSSYLQQLVVQKWTQSSSIATEGRYHAMEKLHKKQTRKWR